MIRNFEVGVLFLPSLTKHSKSGKPYKFQASKAPGISDDTIYFPLPYTLPLTNYGENEKGWVWDRQYIEPDVYGEIWP